MTHSLMAAVLAVCTVVGLACSAQPGAPEGVTLEADMARGPRNAAVTIVEFSDYQ